MSPKGYDILAMPPPAEPPQLTRKRIGLHLSTSGGVQTAAERAYRLGCNTFQIFSSSPRQWKPVPVGKPQCDEMSRLREKYGIAPLAIHTSYLVNLASQTEQFLKSSITAFRAEVERAIALCAEYLVLHPGSFRGRSREEGLALVAESIGKAVEGTGIEESNLTILIENTAGAEFSLGGSFEQVATLLNALRRVAKVGACIDTCHTHVVGMDITSREGYEITVKHLSETIGLHNVKLWHCNDAKAARGSKLDRHQHIGQGTIGLEPFRWLLNDPRFEHCAFIAETPVDEPGDDVKNITALKELALNSGETGHLLYAEGGMPESAGLKGSESRRDGRRGFNEKDR